MKKGKKKETNLTQDYIWLIAHINSEFIHRVEKDLSRFGDIEAYIPTVKVLQKNFKNKAHYEDVPLLFNYGFFKVPSYIAYNPELLQKLKENTACIYSWVKDITRVPESKKLKLKERGKIAPIARVTKEEIEEIKKKQKDISIFSDEELAKLGPGSSVELRGYPFEGFSATILKIDYDKKEVEVEIDVSVENSLLRVVKVEFENVFYTIYKGGYDDTLTNQVSLDELMKNKTINKLYFNYGDK